MFQFKLECMFQVLWYKPELTTRIMVAADDKFK